jgi:iron complex outermembrane receptor protein
VVVTTPLGRGEIEVAKVSLRSLADGRTRHSNLQQPTITETLARQAPSVTVGNISGNDFQSDVNYRGFDATPVTGRPIGLAVYQNGVRNERFADK